MTIPPPIEFVGTAIARRKNERGAIVPCENSAGYDWPARMRQKLKKMAQTRMNERITEALEAAR